MTSWVRLWHDMPTDPKWRVIARKSGQPIPNVLAVFSMILINASANEDRRGVLDNFDSEDVAAALDLLPEDVDAILHAMQGKVLDGKKLTGWDKRQPKRERDDDSTGRVNAWRARQKGETKPRNATKRHVTPPDTDADAETDTSPIGPHRDADWPEIPDWIPAEAWNGFLEMRKEKRAWPTGRAVELMVGKLERWRAQGHDPGMVLDQSTEGNWTGLWEPKNGRGQNNRTGGGFGHRSPTGDLGQEVAAELAAARLASH